MSSEASQILQRAVVWSCMGLTSAGFRSKYHSILGTLVGRVSKYARRLVLSVLSGLTLTISICSAEYTVNISAIYPEQSSLNWLYCSLLVRHWYLVGIVSWSSFSAFLLCRAGSGVVFSFQCFEAKSTNFCG